MKLKKFAALGLAIIAPLSLSGCLILPGEFTSDMTVMKSGEFTFNYKGQIQLLGLANLLNNTLDEMGGSAETFAATCYVDSEEESDTEAKGAQLAKEKSDKKKEKALEDSAENAASLAKIQTSGSGTAASAAAQDSGSEIAVTEAADPEKSDDADSEVDAAIAAADAADAAAAAAAAGTDDYGLTERDCSEKEIAEQKAEWDEAQKSKIDREAEQKKMFSMLLGGIDPKDPKTITRFTKEVERLAAWNKVEHLGDGLFMIDYSTKGRLADDFAFPVIPRYSLGQPMIHITRWDNGRVRVEAPSFHTDQDFSAMAMMGGAGLGIPSGKSNVKPIEVKGTFTLTTDARILANNTEEGPQDSGGMQKLTWDIGPATFGPPMALLKLVQ
jgi:hypothetical protein